MLPDLTHLDAYRQPHPITGYCMPGDTVGVFYIPHPQDWRRRQFGAILIIIACDGEESGWDHVSVHIKQKRNGKVESHTPTWEDMSHVKDLFFSPDELVLQFHPPKGDHINTHPHVLHLWRPLNQSITLPPPELV